MNSSRWSPFAIAAGSLCPQRPHLTALVPATFQTYLGDMTDFSPREIVSELDRFIVGQTDA